MRCVQLQRLWTKHYLLEKWKISWNSLRATQHKLLSGEDTEDPILSLEMTKCCYDARCILFIIATSCLGHCTSPHSGAWRWCLKTCGIQIGALMKNERNKEIFFLFLATYLFFPCAAVHLPKLYFGISFEGLITLSYWNFICLWIIVSVWKLYLNGKRVSCLFWKDVNFDFHTSPPREEFIFNFRKV